MSIKMIDSIYSGYKVCKDGTVIGKRGHPLIPHKDRNGYMNVGISINGKLYTKQVHRIVMESFTPTNNSEKAYVNHIDGDKSNNNLNNLEWCTRSENTLHSYKNKLQKFVGNRYISKPPISENDKMEILRFRKLGFTHKEIATKFNLSRERVGVICRSEGL